MQPIPFTLPDRLMSAQPWVDEDCRRLLTLALPRIVDGLRPYGPEVVFLGGSASLGEAVGWEGEEGRTLLLSDLDLGAIVARPVPHGIGRNLVDPAPGEMPVLTLGCYEARFLDRQAPTPGMVDLAAKAHVLWGDPSALRRFHVPEPAAIPPWEAYRLLGNRCLELDAAEARAGVPAMYAVAKAATDLWTSWTVARGAYCSGWRERSSSLDRDTLRAPADVLAAVFALREFRMHPAPDRLPAGHEPRDLFARGLAAWLEADPGGFRRRGRGLEDAFLREPAGLRNRLQRWRCAWGRPGLPEFAFRLAAGGKWRLTPEGIRMAHSVRSRIAASGMRRTG